MDAASLEKFYTVVYDVAYSPCGRFLVACDNFGRLATFSLAKALGPNGSPASRSPLVVWKGSKGPIYCLDGGSVLFSGGQSSVKCWNWKNITVALSKGSKEPRPQYELIVPPLKQNEMYDVNGIAFDERSNCVYVAFGKEVHCWDLSSQQLKATYCGHSNYIHSLSLQPGSQHFITGGEDGSVKLWDPSQSHEPVHSIQPAKNGKGRSNGNWVGCVAMDESGEWMVCGGGFPPCLYHLGSQSKVATLDVSKKITTHAAIFTSDRVITGGAEGTVQHWAVNGDPLTSVPSSLTHVFTLAHNAAAPQYEVLTVGGDSADIDIFTNFGYKAFSLTMS